ncbi:MAG: hypothetical protein IJ087_01385 [Eggerthellaceae bacterium]|nr:hypothetical protein [Eggerthellaceae bacterium]
MGRSNDNERLVLPCKFGKLVCEVVRDDDEYKEFAIDLHRNDGKVVQVCVVGTNEYDECNGDDKVHVNLWDGEREDSCGVHHIEPYGDGWWGEEEI